MRTNPAVEQNKKVKWSKTPCNQSGRRGKVQGGKDLPKSSKWKIDRVKENMKVVIVKMVKMRNCHVIGESEGDCIWPCPVYKPVCWVGGSACRFGTPPNMALVWYIILLAKNDTLNLSFINGNVMIKSWAHKLLTVYWITSKSDSYMNH